MIQLVAVLWVMVLFFAFIGYLRGVNLEFIGTAGIVLGLFALFNFDPYLRTVLLAQPTNTQIFLIQAVVFIVIVFFAYQQNRALFGRERGGGGEGGRRGRDNRDDVQDKVLGALLGGFNGYLIWGSLWYFLDVNQYPLAPYIIAPSLNSASADALNWLPLVVLGGGVGGNGNLLSLAVIILFVIVLIVL